jgi:hypothetical protein
MQPLSQELVVVLFLFFCGANAINAIKEEQEQGQEEQEEERKEFLDG